MYRPSMNIKQAKQIPLEDFLERLGHKPSRNSGSQLWYLSPLRAEETPSFKINQQRNLWYDFGTGEGGDILDLVKELERTSNTSEALARIAAIVGSGPLPTRSHPPVPKPESTPMLELVHVGPVESRLLFAYLRNRGIDPKQVASIVHEVTYRCGDREHRALALQNDLGGYELRSPSFKGTLGAKAIRTFEGDGDQVHVFEGFFDFLSAVMINDGLLKGTCIVLNSVNMRDKALKVIHSLNPRTVNVYRDHDSAGEQSMEYFRNELPNSAVLDKSPLYIGFKDLNDWYVNERTKLHCTRSQEPSFGQQRRISARQS